jgi:hypothetical protein
MLTVAAVILSAAATTSPATVPAQPALAGTDVVIDYKDPDVALALSIGGTVAPTIATIYGLSHDGPSSGTLIGLGLTGMFLGPGLGHWYAGDYLTAGLGMRVAGGALVVGGALAGLGECGFEENCTPNGGVALMTIGAGLFVGGTIYDIATSGRAANGWNREHMVHMAPTAISSNGHTTMGVGLGGTF